MITHEMARAATTDRCDDLINFTQRLVQTPSLSGEEGDVAAIIVAEMKKLNYDEVWTDDVGNVIAKLNGGNGPTVMLNGHIDVVDSGPADGWPHPPHSGSIVDGELWGRGSVDMKGPVAAMIYAAAQFKQLNVLPAGDVLMTCAVMEEIGGLGSQFMVQTVTADAAIVGEPSRNELRLGHRGRIELQVTFPGRSAHASAPHLAINPHFAAADFLKRLPELQLQTDPIVGPATITPTLYQTDQQSANVTPGELTLFLDWRNVPAESREHAVRSIQTLLDDLSTEDGYRPTVRVTQQLRQTYPGTVRDFASVFPPFATSADAPIAQATQQVIEAATGQPVTPSVWQFATDGGHLAAADISVIGFGPGDDRLAHTNRERLSLEQLKTATALYAPVASALSQVIDAT